MEQVNKTVNVLLGIVKAEADEIIPAFKKAFSTKGMDIDLCVSKYDKLGIEQYIAEHNNIDVLIVSEYLQKSKPYEIADYERLIDLNNKLTIVPILNDDRKGSAYVSSLISLGIYNAIFQKDAQIANIAELACNGRTRKEAKYYYGAENINDVVDTANLQTCIDHITFGGDKETTKDRADYIKTRVTGKEFELIISKLPKDIRERLRVYDDYSGFFDASVDDKKGIITNVLSIFNSNDKEEEAPLIVKQEVQSAVKKVIIGLAGSESKIGTTHQAILFANFLNSAGYKVAVVESDFCEHRSLDTIHLRYNVKSQGEYYSFKGVDYYPYFSLEDINRVFLQDYNFVIIDFGVYNEKISLEFGRCVVQIIVCGSKTWQLSMMERLLLLVKDESILKKFNYLFVSTPDSEKKVIIKNMGVLDKVFFADYQPDPFVNDGYSAMKQILQDYLPSGNYLRKEGLWNKIQSIFE